MASPLARWRSWPHFPDTCPDRLHQAVQGREVGARAGLDDVGGRSAAGYDGAVEIDLHRNLADSVLARGGRSQRVILQSPLEPGNGLDGGQDRVDRTVAH